MVNLYLKTVVIQLAFLKILVLKVRNITIEVIA